MYILIVRLSYVLQQLQRWQRYRYKVWRLNKDEVSKYVDN